LEDFASDVDFANVSQALLSSDFTDPVCGLGSAPDLAGPPCRRV
jgi:hypothetical protein